MARGFTATRRRLTLLRLAALDLALGKASQPPEQAVRRLLAVQAQDYEAALWAIGARSGAARGEVVAAHETGRFVRSWPLRGTLHFVAAEDLGWLLALGADRVLRSIAGRQRRLGLTASVIDRAADLATGLLHGGRSARRGELTAALAADGIPTSGQRGAEILLTLALNGHIVLRAKNDWVLAQEWLPAQRTLGRDAALHELAVRYFHSRGPATVRDLAWWASLTLTDARLAADAARDELEALSVDGVEHFVRPGLEPAPRGAWLLPAFDEYLLGYADRSAPLAGAELELVAPGRNGLFRPTIAVNGQVVGLWRSATAGGRATVALEPFDHLTAGMRAGLERAARRYERFLHAPVTVDGLP